MNSPLEMMMFVKMLGSIEWIRRAEIEDVYDRFMPMFEDLEEYREYALDRQAKLKGYSENTVIL